ncbi:MAG: TonB-dependent receptor [Alphaproteobacteria bacterium]
MTKIAIYFLILFLIPFMQFNQKASASLVDEIVVTASKEDTQILKVGGNISSINTDEIKFINAINPSEILNRLPAVYISQGSGQEHLTSIRSPVLSGGAGAGSFLYLEDGIPLRSPGFGNVNGLMESIIEIGDRTEVVRGPGSALYGSNAVHGLINVITPTPSEEKKQIIRTQFSDQEFTIDGSYSGPTQKGGVVLNLFWREDNGYSHNESIDQPHYGQQKFLFRWDNSEGINDYIFTLTGANLNQETKGYVKGYKIYNNKNISKINPDPEAFRDTYSIRSSFKIIKNYLNSKLSITPYIRYNEMDFKMHFLPGKPLETNSHKSIGIQSIYSKKIQNLTWFIGSDIEFTEGKLSEFQDSKDVSFGPRLAYPQGPHYDFSIDSKILSLYFNTEWLLNDRAVFTAGVRAENVEYDYKTNIPSGTKGRIQVSPNRSDDFTDISLKTSFSYMLKENNFLFTNLSIGNRAPQVTDLYRIQSKQVPGGADSEKLESFEIGFRGISIGGLEYEIVGYTMKKEDYFFRDSQGFNVENGVTKHNGIEFNYFKTFGDNFEISGSLSFADHEYDFNHTPNKIVKGNTIDSAPKELANTRFIYLPSMGGKFELEWIRVGDYPINESNAHNYEGHDIFNLRLKRDLVSKTSIGLTVRNLTDERYATRADYAFGSYRYFVGNEREFYFSLEREF